MQAIDIPGTWTLRTNWNSAGLAGVVGALGLLGFLPFVWTVHDFPLTSLDSELVASACLAFGLMSCGLLIKREPSLNWPLPTVLLGLAAIALLQLAIGMLPYTQLAVRLILFVLTMLAAYVLGRRIISIQGTQDAVDVFSSAILIGGLYSVLVQWLQLLDLEVLPYWAAIVYRNEVLQQRPFGNLAQANHVTTYLAMAAMSALYLGARTRRSWIIVPSLLALSCGLGMAGSRMGTVFLGIALAALFAPTALRPASVRWRWMGSAALVLGYVAGLIAVRELVGEFDTVTRFGQDTLPLRLELWKQAWRISLEHPLLGVGTGQFAAGQYWVAQAGPYTYAATNCHNLILELAVEFGWPACIAVCIVVASWFVRDLRARLAQPELALAWGMIALIVIHSMLEFPLWHLYFAVPASLLFALAEPDRGQARSLGIQRILPVAGIAILVVSFAIRLDYIGVARAGAPLWLEIQHLRNRTPEDSLSVIAVGNSVLFRPEVEHLLLELRHPPDENTNGPLERSARVLRTFPAPELIAQYIAFLARAGRADDAIVHIARLRAFAHGDYAIFRDWILDQTRDLGPQTAPLRHALRELH